MNQYYVKLSCDVDEYNIKQVLNSRNIIYEFKRKKDSAIITILNQHIFNIDEVKEDSGLYIDPLKKTQYEFYVYTEPYPFPFDEGMLISSLENTFNGIEDFDFNIYKSKDTIFFRLLTVGKHHYFDLLSNKTFYYECFDKNIIIKLKPSNAQLQRLQSPKWSPSPQWSSPQQWSPSPQWSSPQSSLRQLPRHYLGSVSGSLKNLQELELAVVKKAVEKETVAEIIKK